MDDELKDPTFNRITDRWLWEGKIDPDDYYGLTDRQKDCIQWYKRAVNRNKYGRQTERDADCASSSLGA